MSLPKDLLLQARQLLGRGAKGRPKQASLRRSVSTAYYALFHLLTESSAEFLVSGNGPGRDALRRALRRRYSHRYMKQVSNSFGGGTPPEIWRSAAGQVSGDLRTVAKTFVNLQEARHEADYDHTHPWTRHEASELVLRAEGAFRAWQNVRRNQDACAYCVALLATDLKR